MVDAVVVSESKDDIKRLSEELANRKNKYEKMYKVGSLLTTIGEPALAVTLLSPFDIEGPVAEIVSAVAIAAGIIMKNISQNKLEKIDAIITTGNDSGEKMSIKVDEKDVNNLKIIFDKYVNSKSNSKAM